MNNTYWVTYSNKFFKNESTFSKTLGVKKVFLDSSVKDKGGILSSVFLKFDNCFLAIIYN